MLKILRQITKEMNAASSTEQALAFVVKHLCETLPIDACSIFLCDNVNGEYVLAATEGLNAKLIGKARLKFGHGLIGVAGEREEPINVDDAHAHPEYAKYPGLMEEAYHGYLGVPIIEQGELLGVLVAQQRQAQFLGEEEEAFCVTLAIQLAVDIARARAKGALQEIGKRRRKKRLVETVLNGVSGASGIAIGDAVVVFPPADLNAVPDQAITDVDAEIAEYEAALAKARDEIHALQDRAKKSLSVTENVLFDAYLRILDSRTLSNEIIDGIKQGQWAQGALKHVIKRHVLQFESLDDVYLRERATDFRDLGRRILAHLQSKEKEELQYTKKTILVSDEVTATALMEVPKGDLVGVISGTGSSNSHVAILARALGLPAVMGVTGMPLSQLAGKELIVDGYNGQIYLSPHRH